MDHSWRNVAVRKSLVLSCMNFGFKNRCLRLIIEYSLYMGLFSGFDVLLIRFTSMQVDEVELSLHNTATDRNGIGWSIAGPVNWSNYWPNIPVFTLAVKLWYMNWLFYLHRDNLVGISVCNDGK